MTLHRERALPAFGLMVTLVLSLVTISGSSFAQDNSQGRYRPEGRQIGLAAGREFDERVYEVRTYQPDVSSDAFAGAMVFYPLTLSFDLPNGAIAFVPGFRANAAMYEWWGPALASLGYTVFILETNSPTDTLAARADALIAAVDFIKSENQNTDAPIVNKIDPDKIAIMGHSMGGGASLVAAAELGNNIAQLSLSHFIAANPANHSAATTAMSVRPPWLLRVQLMKSRHPQIMPSWYTIQSGAQKSIWNWLKETTCLSPTAVRKSLPSDAMCSLS